MARSPSPGRLLRDRFGFATFRPGQEPCIRALVAGRDVLAVLPTGSGKSLTYQLTALLLPGLTVVVSPLLALMKDQVDSLRRRGIPVEVVSSDQGASACSEALARSVAGQTRLLYLTPERLDDEAFVRTLASGRLSLVVVDEAHSISEWGHSFRPAYLSLGGVIEQLGRPPVLALTATATPWVRADIVERLRLRDPLLVVTGTDRPNLRLEVIRVEEEHEDRRVLRQLLVGDKQGTVRGPVDRLLRGSGIIYTATTQAAEETVGWLRGWGISADAYHGRRPRKERDRVQDGFMRGDLRVIVATNAFGMGVDKPDVRFVIHRDVPPSLEAYYQEAGRAGRDGKPARCVLIFRPGDLGRAAFLAGGGELTREEVVRARAALGQQSSGTLRELEQVTGLGRADLVRLLSLLKAQGAASERGGRFNVRLDRFDANALPLEQEARRRAYERSRLEVVRAYAELRECRRRFLLHYFGETYPKERCGRCDLDRGRRARIRRGSREDPGPFEIGQRVRHPGWGNGVVQHLAPDTVTVLFDGAGYHTLALDLIREQQLLTAA